MNTETGGLKCNRKPTCILIGGVSIDVSETEETWLTSLSIRTEKEPGLVERTS